MKRAKSPRPLTGRTLTLGTRLLLTSRVWTSERLAIVYFLYVAAVCWLRPVAPSRRLALALIAVGETAAIVWVARSGFALLRQWAPAATILVGYYASGLLFIAPSPRVERWLMSWDRRWLGDPRTRFQHWPRPLVAALEYAYMGCFALIGGGLLILVWTGHAAVADRYWTLVVGAEFGSFAPLAFIQSRPPWAVERKPVLADRAVHDLATHMVKTFTIHANTFPSGHVAGSLAVAIAVAEVMPMTGAALMLVAMFITLATIVGRYHYCLDAVAAVGLVGLILLIT